MRYFLVDLQNTRYKESVLNNENLHWGDTLLIPKLRNGLVTCFFKIEGLDEALNPLNAELNPICYLLALLGAHHFLHVSRIRVK